MPVASLFLLCHWIKLNVANTGSFDNKTFLLDIKAFARSPKSEVGGSTMKARNDYVEWLGVCTFVDSLKFERN